MKKPIALKQIRQEMKDVLGPIQQIKKAYPKNKSQ